jgi:hypothetical protein
LISINAIEQIDDDNSKNIEPAADSGKCNKKGMRL